MAEDYVTTTDNIIQLLYDKWQLDAAAAAGTSSPPELVILRSKSGHGEVDRSALLSWGRITVTHNEAPSRSIGGGAGRSQLKGREGFAWVECRVANLDGTGARKALKLGQVAQKAFERAHVGSLWFPRVVLREVGDEDRRWERVDVLAYFEWTEAVTSS